MEQLGPLRQPPFRGGSWTARPPWGAALPDVDGGFCGEPFTSSRRSVYSEA